MGQSLGEAVFSPLDINQESMDLNLANNCLAADELWKYAALATSMRREIETRAAAADPKEENQADLLNR